MHAHSLGRLGEDMAAAYLEEKGYRILDRNVVLTGGEIDLVAEKEGRLFFIEVKTRMVSNLAAADSLPPSKINRLERAIDAYLAERDFEEWEALLLCVELAQGTAKIREVPL